MSARWERQNGYDANGNRVILITENGGEKPYCSLATRFQVACLKIAVALGAVCIGLGMLGGIIHF